MAVFKCKMCGGDLEILDNATVCECEYCGTKQTVPVVDNEKKLTLFNRANKLRLNNEFDKAAGVYESIVSEFPEEAESYWGLVLCKYGIEYVDDKKTAKKIPTCHRTIPSTIVEDEDFKKAIEYANTSAKSVYKAEAKAIDKLQKQILKIVEAEEPYDVFICYKETDSNGQRTEDSAIAQDIYTELVKEGYRVFFSRVTLRDKAGSEYEPYIYSALSSAKVMLAIGTKEEYYDAVWVKNEWGRYLSMMADDKSKHLIPCYKDLDAYDIPNEFKNLQALNMADVTFFKSLLANIKKFVKNTSKVTEAVSSNPAVANIDSLLKRAFMFLEDGEFENANQYAEKVLDIDPENALGYLGKLMVELQVKTKEELENCAKVFNKSANYQKIVRFGDEELVNELNGYIKTINSRNVEIYYNQVVSAIPNATRREDFEKIIVALEKIENYKDSDEKIAFCKSKIDELRKADEEAERLIKEAEIAAEQKAEEERKEAERKAEIARKEAEQRAKRNKKVAGVVASVVCIIIAFVIILNTVIIPNGKYNDAVALMDAGKYSEAISAFKLLNGYKDSETMIQENRYKSAIDMIDSGNYTEAITVFEALDGYKDSVSKISECNNLILENSYNSAIESINSKEYIVAYETLIKLNGYKDSREKAGSILKKYLCQKAKNLNSGDSLFFGIYEQDNNTSTNTEYIEWLVLEVKNGKALIISKYALDGKPYNTSYTDVTWETCTLRKWLNNDFINVAFSADEKSLIPTVTVSADKNPRYNTNPGKATRDKVFLLSIAEVNKYLSGSAGQCKPTVYTFANDGAYNLNYCYWWMRSPGDSQNYAAISGSGGGVNAGGSPVYSTYAVRPALWISI